MFFSSDFSRFKVEAASAFTAVCAYHPWRTLASRVMSGERVTVNPMTLYVGFTTSAVGAHQLFVIPSVYQMFHTKYDSLSSAAMAGVASAPSVAFCDALTERKQSGLKTVQKTCAVVFRGFTPTAFRQVGLAMGMFVFPPWAERAVAVWAPSVQGEDRSKAPYAFAGGVAAAVLTHYPDTVRVLMQRNQQMTMPQACRSAFTVMRSSKGMSSCILRVVVVGVAFTAMRMGREYYPIMFNKEEKQS